MTTRAHDPKNGVKSVSRGGVILSVLAKDLCPLPTSADASGYWHDKLRFVASPATARRVISPPVDSAAERLDQLFDRANLLIGQRRYELAQRDCHEALAIDPNNPYAHSQLAICRMNLGDARAAHELARRTIELAPDLAEGYVRHAWTIVRDPAFRDFKGPSWWPLQAAGGDSNDRRRYFAALRLLDDAIRIEPTRAYAWQLTSSCWRQLGEAQRSLDAADRGLAIAPRDVDLLERRAVALHMLGRNAEALEATRHALAINPEHPSSLHRLGQFLLRDRRYTEALHALIAAIRLNPHNPDLRNDLFEAMQTQGLFFRWAYRIHSLARPTGPLSLGNFAVIIILTIGVLALIVSVVEVRSKLKSSSSPLAGIVALIILLLLITPLLLLWLRHFSRFILTFHREARYLQPVTSRVGSHFATFIFPALILVPIAMVLKMPAVAMVPLAATMPLAAATAQIAPRPRAGFFGYALLFTAGPELPRNERPALSAHRGLGRHRLPRGLAARAGRPAPSLGQTLLIADFLS
jgi:tetratricopeptide (TPR) repeat protein